MTNQMIEEVKRQAELAEIWLSDFPLDRDGEVIFTEPSDEASIGFADSLIAANELLQQVVVLEVGAKVEAYDIVCQEGNEPDVQFVGNDHHEHRGHYMSATTINRINKDPDEIHYKIIQRNGKPVIYQQGTK